VPGKLERADIVVMWSLTALSKLTVRLNHQNKGEWEGGIKEILKRYRGHAIVEIQSRACEFTQILDQKWESERLKIFDAMPFKGDENMLVDAKDRAAIGDDDGDDNDDALLGLE
jgi:hypothetical protein